MKHAGSYRRSSGAATAHDVPPARGQHAYLRPLRALVAIALGVSLFTVVFASASQAADACVSGNAIACENSKPGSPSSEWEIGGQGDGLIEGFTTDISTNVGGTVNFKIHSTAAYTMDIYRMGYYGGDGARKQASVTTNTAVSQANLPSKCINNSSSTGLIDCGTWGVSATWTVPATAVSGVYFAHISQANGADAHVVFDVRNDASHSDLIFQTSDTSWQAYNNWGGNSLYAGEPAGRAYKVSYNRPFNTRGTPGGRDFVWANEYPMIRFLEAQGYDVSYQSGVDTDRYGSLLANHKTFLSVGHDEYWSGNQRKNVEAARDAGVNLAFFSANEVYWKTRYEPSVDGSSTNYRTLVTYKESADNARTDPEDIANGTWTGTWRDPRFSPPADGGRPENNLTGTIFTVNSGTNYLKVPAADGKLRFWRNTAAATQAAGATYNTPQGTLGYEWDEDLDNGFRPAGAIKMSTANWDVPEKLTGYDSTVAPGNATHSLVLYRASSGALVFGAGTVQWSWGLDATHDGDTTPTDPAMRQATINLFADMNAQPTTLESNLTAATKSTDTTPPASAITSPAAGASLASGSTVTVTGTASDVGGVVGGVEVSLDSGATWHPATGRATWSYTGTLEGAGATTIQVRASDDSANIQTTPTTRQITISCPCTLFGGETPTTASDTDTSSIELGVRFRSSIDGYITGVSFYKGPTNTGTHTGTLWGSDGSQLATGTFTNETSSGWQRLLFTDPIRISAGQTYIASYHAPSGGYATTAGYFSGHSTVNSPLTAPATTDAAPNGVYSATTAVAFPNSTFKGGNYWVSPIFDTVAPPDVTPPSVTGVNPITNSSSIRVTTTPTVGFSEPIKAGSLTLQLSSSAGLVSGTTTFDSARKVATFTPAASLATGTTYTLKTAGGTDDAGNALPVFSSTFKTVTSSAPGACPCTIWSDSDVPATTTVNDSASVELGVKFTASDDGFINGVRFYKGPQNVGTHTGTLWTSTGTQLATTTFVNESSTGWQEALFSKPVAITAGTTYVASYHSNGFYSASPGALATAVTNGPLTALASSASGGNGVYGYSTATSFPTSEYGASSYGVDVVYDLPVDTTPPAVASAAPGASATSVATATIPKLTFSEKIVSGLAITLKTGGTTVPATVALDATSRIATITPASALLADTTYTVAVSGAADKAGNVMAPYSYSFTTSGTASCPCSLYASDQQPAVPSSNDSSALELGVRITPSVNGYITGVRFYKGSGNTGTHVGSLWNASGGLVTSATFTGETASGWQTVKFPAPVPVTAGTSYVASYSDPLGHYAADSGQFAADYVNGPLTGPASAAGAGNGVYATTIGRFPANSYNSSGYGVDVSFAIASQVDTVPPSLVSTNPVSGATSVPLTRAAVATFNEALDAASVQATVTGPNAVLIPSTFTVGADNTVTVTPSAALANNTSYTVKITGPDLAGNALTAPAQWSFQTARASSTACPCSIWTDDSSPAIATDSDTRSIEVGVKFSSASSGYVTGLRFYRGAGNTGTHVGTLWSSTGTELAKATFANESAAGWQEVTFAQSVPVTAGTTYVASYHASNGGFSATVGGLTSAVVRGPLTAAAGTADAPNGVYTYGADRVMPATGTNSNYWVDVLFDTAPPADTTPPTVTTVAPAAAATGVLVGSPVDATFSEPVTPASVQMTLKTAAGVAVSGTTVYDASTRIARFTPAARLGDTTAYNATATGTDLAGNAMTAVKAWSFTTGDGTPPTVGTQSPAAGATAVLPDSTVSAVFSEPITTATLQFTVTRSGSPVPGAVAYDATTRQATFTPTSGLPQGVTLAASLTAADTTGNAMTAPATWTFATKDITPPVVSAVTAAGSGTAGTAATVTWTTDEVSTSVVQYGTTATALTSAASTAGNVTAHSVALTGLTKNTRYYYRVTSADPTSNSTTSPATTAAAAQYVPAVAPITQTTTADFTTGTLATTYVSPRSGGDIVLAPAATQEFTGTTVPSGWTSTSLATGSSVTVAGDLATVSGRLFKTTSSYSTTREADIVATLKPVTGQWLGMTDDDFSGATDHWAAFRTTTTGALVAEVDNGLLGTTTSTALSSSYIGTAHRYEIDWGTNQTVFKVDGTTVATIARGVTVAMNVAFRDPTVDANPIVVDSVWVSPYAASGTYTSAVIDAGATVDWGLLTGTATAPAGTTVTYQVRTGPNATAGGTGWTAWTTVASGGDIPGNTRYLQYRATLTTNSTRNLSPNLSQVDIAFAVL